MTILRGVMPFMRTARRSLHCERNFKGVSVSWPALPNVSSYRCAYTCKETGDSGFVLTCAPKADLPHLSASPYVVTVSPLTPSGTYASDAAYTCSLDVDANVHPNLVSNSPASATAPVTGTEISKLDIRVGRIVAISRHPNADNLYVEQVDVGEACSRTIVSGLVPYCTEESLVGSLVTVLCNLKPRNIKGIASAGMLLCSSNGDHTKVEPLRPPSSCIVGEVISFPGYAAEPCEAGNRAVKAFSKVVPELRVENGTATFKGIPFTTSRGPCTSGIEGSIS